MEILIVAIIIPSSCGQPPHAAGRSVPMTSSGIAAGVWAPA